MHHCFAISKKKVDILYKINYSSHPLLESDFPTYRLTKRRLPNFLPNYPLPQALRDCMEAQSDVLVVQPCLGEVSIPMMKFSWSCRIM